jgi:hypothetical protein
MEEADPEAGVVVTLSDNWLVYAFREAASLGKPTRLVSVELYEGSKGLR